MAIHNLSGNFQPPSVSTGRNLPPTASRDAIIVSDNNQVGLRVVSTKAEALNGSDGSFEIQKKTTESQAKNDNSEIEKFQQFNQSINRSLQFKIDQELGVTIVRVIDRDTDELIRQFPPEELINLSRRLKELNEEQAGNSGVLLREKV